MVEPLVIPFVSRRPASCRIRASTASQGWLVAWSAVGPGTPMRDGVTAL